tara:strand:+ start:569 stop:733 length:165 start_codon:yes stop_codon:yes gene_type:complete
MPPYYPYQHSIFKQLGKQLGFSVPEKTKELGVKQALMESLRGLIGESSQFDIPE